MGDNVFPKVIRQLLERKRIKTFDINEDAKTVYLYFTDGTRVEFIYEFPSPFNNITYESIRLVIFSRKNNITYDG